MKISSDAEEGITSFAGLCSRLDFRSLGDAQRILKYGNAKKLDESLERLERLYSLDELIECYRTQKDMSMREKARIDWNSERDDHLTYHEELKKESENFWSTLFELENEAYRPLVDGGIAYASRSNTIYRDLKDKAIQNEIIDLEDARRIKSIVDMYSEITDSSYEIYKFSPEETFSLLDGYDINMEDIKKLGARPMNRWIEKALRYESGAARRGTYMASGIAPAYAVSAIDIPQTDFTELDMLFRFGITVFTLTLTPVYLSSKVSENEKVIERDREFKNIMRKL